MRLFRTLLLLLTAVLSATCTEPNPGFVPTSDGSFNCTVGERSCSGQNTLICVPRPGNATAFEVERTCPGGSSCASGLCVPDGAPCGSSPCDPGKVCMVFVNPVSPDKLGTYCAAPLGPKPAGAPCTKDADCASGACVGKTANFRICYRPCGKEKDCGAVMRCAELSLTVNGVKGTVWGCTL